MKHYCTYYAATCTHLSLDKNAPIPRPIAPTSAGRIVAIPQVGGLHHRYDRRLIRPLRRARAAAECRLAEDSAHDSADAVISMLWNA